MATPVITTHKSLLPSHEFYLAAGTVTVDRAARKALVLYDRLSGLHGLPRGRADWGEALTDAATRETYEEAGIRCTLLPVPVPTRATPPPSVTGRDGVVHGLSSSASLAVGGRPESTDEVDGEVGDNTLGEVTLGVPLTEPFALLTHFRSNGALAVVHWFVAEADSTIPPEEGTQMADEEYEARWVGFEEAVALMPDANHAGIVRRAVVLVEKLERMEMEAAADIAADNRSHLNRHATTSKIRHCAGFGLDNSSWFASGVAEGYGY